MIVDVHKVADILVECAESYILPRYKMLGEHEITAKTGPRDLVTQADLDVEAHLMRKLPVLLPGSVVVGEEAASADERVLDILRDKSRMIWVVDPVDGTYNFVHHRRHFGVMLACIIDGRTRYSWIYDVLGREMMMAARGEGAFIGETRLKVGAGAAQVADLKGHMNTRYFPKKYQDHLQAAMQEFKECHSLHCAAHEYLDIARGGVDFAVYSRLKPWDHLPGVLMVEEAGGYAAQWDGSPYTPQDRHVGLISACNKDVWQVVFDHLIKNIL